MLIQLTAERRHEPAGSEHAEVRVNGEVRIVQVPLGVESRILAGRARVPHALHDAEGREDVVLQGRGSALELGRAEELLEVFVAGVRDELVPFLRREAVNVELLEVTVVVLLEPDVILEAQDAVLLPDPGALAEDALQALLGGTELGKGEEKKRRKKETKEGRNERRTERGRGVRRR